MPRVSVIVAAYNSAATVRATLDSVLAQTYEDWEVVLADDASTDDTAEIARSYGERVQVVVAERNAGRPAATRALGLEHARGELVAFLDADDLWTPRYLARMVALYDESGGRAGIVACDARLLLPDGTIPTRTYADEAGRAAGLTVERLLRSNPVYTSALVPRTVIDEAGGLAADLMGTDDHDLWLRILELGYGVVATDEPLAVYRLRSDSLSRRLAEMARQSEAVYRRALVRGRLTPRQRRIAERRLRLQQAIARFEELGQARSEGRLAAGDVARSAPLLARAGVENLVRVPAGAVRRARAGRAPRS